MDESKKLLVLLYCDKYDEKLKEFNKQFNSHSKVKYSVIDNNNYKHEKRTM